MASNEVIINAACMGKNPTHSAAQAWQTTSLPIRSSLDGVINVVLFSKFTPTTHHMFGSPNCEVQKVRPLLPLCRNTTQEPPLPLLAARPCATPKHLTSHLQEKLIFWSTYNNKSS
jgi:hypothetical protein